MKNPIQWDGTQKSANKVLRHMPDLTVSTCGGAPNYPVQLFLHTKTGKQVGEAKPGDWIGINQAGSACVVDGPRASIEYDSYAEWPDLGD